VSIVKIDDEQAFCGFGGEGERLWHVTELRVC